MGWIPFQSNCLNRIVDFGRWGRHIVLFVDRQCALRVYGPDSNSLHAMVVALAHWPGLELA
jgi:hypothetical protein